MDCTIVLVLIRKKRWRHFRIVLHHRFLQGRYFFYERKPYESNLIAVELIMEAAVTHSTSRSSPINETSKQNFEPFLRRLYRNNLYTTPCCVIMEFSPWFLAGICCIVFRLVVDDYKKFLRRDNTASRRSSTNPVRIPSSNHSRALPFFGT